jgi:asparagine synthase (glutamine-hydrolysing)
MCGIWAFVGNKSITYSDETVNKCFEELANRGPETKAELKINFVVNNVHLGFTRLAINGLTPEGNQPMFEDGIYWICNGEIYNWKNIAESFNLNPKNKSESDCSILGALWRKLSDEPDGTERFFRALDGVFAMVLVDTERKKVVIGRDPYGVRPLFMGENKLSTGGGLYFASEMKALVPFNNTNNTLQILQFPPGSYAEIDLTLPLQILSNIRQYHQVPWLKVICGSDTNIFEHLQGKLKNAVQKRLLTERPIAALLSGGIDSSLIAALVASKTSHLKTFSIGFEGSEDLRCARIVANHIGSDHTEIVSTPDKFFASIPEVIRAIESYDITTVRASVGNYLVSKAIREKTDCKVVFNGDGSDEIFGSYLYFYRAPTDEAFEAETTRLLKDICYFDVLRSDRSISCHGLEPRTPFLDKEFVATAKALPTNLRRPGDKHCEKWVLRRAFDGTGLLPDEILWRRKEAFSDGVSSKTKPWYQEIQERIKNGNLIPENWEAVATEKYQHNCPKTAEAFYYRQLFESFFGEENSGTIPYFWMPKWSGETSDPSARTLSLY